MVLTILNKPLTDNAKGLELSHENTIYKHHVLLILKEYMDDFFVTFNEVSMLHECH